MSATFFNNLKINSFSGVIAARAKHVYSYAHCNKVPTIGIVMGDIHNKDYNRKIKIPDGNALRLNTR